MKRVKWIVAILAVAALCLIGMTALADGEGLALRVNGSKVGENTYTNSYYYKIYIDNIPEGANGVQIGYGAPDASAPDNPWFQPVGRLRRDSHGLFTISLPEDESASNQSDAFFARLGESDDWLKVVLEYDTEKKNGNVVDLPETMPAPVLNEDYTITWTDGATENADAYIVYWKKPNDENPIGFFISGEDENGTRRNSLNLFSQGQFGDVYDLTRYMGTYETWVETYVGNQVGCSTHKTLTMEWPEDTNPQIHLMSSEADENGVITVPIYGEVQVTVTADEEVIRNYIQEFHFVNGLWTEGISPWELWQRGYERKSWRPYKENTADQYYTVYAYAIIPGENEQPDRLVRSNKLTVHTTMTKQIAGDVTYQVVGATAAGTEENPIQVPKDGNLVLRVNNIDADYYGAEINEPGMHLDHIAESRWVVAEPGDTTEVRLPVFECEAGRKYEVQVYALTVGAPMKYATQTIWIQVAPEAQAEDKVILQIAKDPDQSGVYQYETDERIRIYGFYENLNHTLNEENSWVQVTAYNDNKDYCFWNESGNGFYYWTDGMRIGQPGDYVIEAVVMTNDGDWNSEARMVEDTLTTRQIHVSADDSKGQLPAPSVTLTPSDEVAEIGTDNVTLTFSKTTGADRYFYWVHRAGEDNYDDLMNGEMTEPGSAAIDTGLLGPGVYAVETSVHGRGYIENNQVLYFAALASDDMLVHKDGYDFTCNAEAAPAGAETDCIAEACEDIRFIFYRKGAEGVRLYRQKGAQGEQECFADEETPGVCRWELFGEEGMYTIYASAKVNGVWSAPAQVCTIAVSADRGDLDAPAVKVNGSETDIVAMNAGKPQELTVTFPKVENAEQYYFEIRRDGEGWTIWNTGFNAEEVEGNTVELTFDNDNFHAGGVYRLYCEAKTPGYNRGLTERVFLLKDANAEPNLTVKVNGSTEAVQEAYSSTDVHVEVTWPEGQGTQGRPTAVRILNNNSWEYMWGREDDFRRDWGFGDGTQFFYAEATWDDTYDFEQLDRDGWGDFDWDRDVTWTGKSNIIKLNVTSPNGTMIAPTVTITNPNPAWGEDLVINIADEGPMVIDPEAAGGKQVAEGGWFFLNIQQKRYNEYGSWWDHQEFDYQLRSGVNRIPTYWMEENGEYRFEIGADGEGYSGKSRDYDITIGERAQGGEPVSIFTVNGSTASQNVLTHNELQVAAYQDGAEWYHVVITEKGNNDWDEHLDNCRCGMLLDSWRSEHAGEFTLKAYAHGHHKDDEGNIIEQDGTDEWEALIGTIVVTYEAPNGDLGELTARMTDKAYVGDQITLTFNQIANEPNGTEYGYWIHEDDNNEWLMGRNYPSAGTVTIDTSRLTPDVYWVEMDAMAPGYNQSHAVLHLALMDPDDTDLSPQDNAYYFTTSMKRPTVAEGEAAPETDFVIRASEDYRFTFYVPGAEEVSLKQKRSDWDEANGFAGRDGPGVSQWHSFDRRGEYTIYGQYRVNGEWSEDIPLCTVTVTAEGSLERPWVDMPMTVQAGEDVHITYHIQQNVRNYSYWVSFEDDNNWQAGEWIDINELDEDRIDEENNTIDLVIPANRLEANRAYHVYLDVNAPGYEQGHDERQLFVLGSPDAQAVTLTVNDQGGQAAQQIQIGNRYPVTVSAPGAERLFIWWDESLSFIDIGGDRFEGEFCLDWKGGEGAPNYCTFYAFGIYNGSQLKVSTTKEIPLNRAAADATAPALTLLNQGTIYRGQFVRADVGAIADTGVYEYNAYITDADGNWICHNGRGDAGVIALPTNDLVAGETYLLRAYARVPGKYRTDSQAIEFTVSEPSENIFIADKTTVVVKERMTVSIVAPGAERVRFNSGYGGWDEFDGDSWYNDYVSWDMSEDEVTIEAEALFPNSEEWVPIGDGIPVTITADGRLDQPQFIDVPEAIIQGEDLNIAVEDVTGAEEYELQLERLDGRDGLYFRSGSPSFYIPGYRLYDGGYRIRVYAMAYGMNAGQNETNLYVRPIRPEMRIASVVSNTQKLDIEVPLIGENKEYHLMIHPVATMNIVYDRKLYDDDAEDDILTFTVPANTLADGGYWVDCYVGGDNFFAENSKAFLVKNGEGTDDNITLKLNGKTVTSADIQINEKFRVSATAPGARAIIIRFGDHWNAFPGDEAETEFSEWQPYPETLYAQAYYGDAALPTDPWDNRWLNLDWGAPSETVQIIFYATGQAGEPWGRFPKTIRQGEILVISDIYPGDGGNETHANINRNAPWQEEDWVLGDNWLSWNESSRTIYLPTIDLEAGRDYWIMLDNSGVGMTGNRMWWRVSVLPGEVQPEGSVAISSLAKAQAGMVVPVSVSAKGAVEVGFGLDVTDKADIETYQFRGVPGEDTYFTRGDWFRIDEPGEHTLTAYAVFPNSDTLVCKDTTITICEPLRFDMTEMPGFFTEGQNDASVTVKLPVNAERMSIQVRVEGDDYRKDIYESRDQDEYADKTIQIPAEYLTAGRQVMVSFQARAEGFTDIGTGVTIPVVAEAQSNLVNLRLVNNREDQTALDLNDIWANEEMVFLATPASGNEITAIRFYNGLYWWDGGEAITRDTHDDWFLDDGSVYFQERYNEDNNRTITAFAEVRVNGSNDWQRTNEISFTVKNRGRVGEFDFADGSDITVPRGTVVTVTFTQAENATHYWVDAFDENRGWSPWSWDNGTTVRINTNRMPAGEYELRGRAGGNAGSGLMWRESTGYVKLTITDNAPPMAEATFTTPSGLTMIEEEAFAGIAARVILITQDVETVGDHAFSGAPVEQAGFLNANTEIHRDAFADCDYVTVYGIPGGRVEQWAEQNNYTFYPLNNQ